MRRVINLNNSSFPGLALRTAKRKANLTGICATSLALLALLAAPAQAQAKTKAEKSPLSLRFTIGAEYDSNVSVDALDRTTNIGDNASLFKAKANYRLPLGKDTEFKLGYSFSQSKHETFSNFDIRTQMASANIVHDFGSVKTGLAYRHSTAQLDGDDFLTLRQISPYLSGFINKKVFVRASYTQTDKSFDNRPVRDAESRMLGADVYFFLRGVRRYWIVGYKRENEDAQGPEFDFDANHVRVKYQQRFVVGGKDLKMGLGWRYEGRAYNGITPSINMIREDNRNRYQAEIEYPLTPSSFIQLEFERADYDSNLPSADYNQNLAIIRLGFEF
jgi:hypothetical protein